MDHHYRDPIVDASAAVDVVEEEDDRYNIVDGSCSAVIVLDRNDRHKLDALSLPIRDPASAAASKMVVKVDNYRHLLYYWVDPKHPADGFALAVAVAAAVVDRHENRDCLVDPVVVAVPAVSSWHPHS